MSAMEKVAWTELLISGCTIAIVTALYPWLGNGATGAFGLLGFIACGALFLRRQGNTVVVDERDREIEQQATRTGIGAAWMILFLALAAIVLWSSFANDSIIPTALITWLVWVQLLVCYGVKGFVAIRLYRRQHSAT